MVKVKVILISVLCFHFSLFTSHFSVCSAQATHRCWDISIVPATPGETDNLLPYTLQRITEEPLPTDSGMLLVEMGREYLGSPYRYGGRTPKGFDCAGFALFLYRRFGYNLPGWSGAQYKLGREIGIKELRPGDLVFFGGRRKTQTVGHTGIVVSADTVNSTFFFIHSSSSNGVIISRSTEAYYTQRYIGARRIFR
ncbi:MAG: C40 family peptidase [bacterium]